MSFLSISIFRKGIGSHLKTIHQGYWYSARGGNTRSVAVSFILKYKYEIESLTASLERNTPDTIRMLIDWCHFFIVVDKTHIDRLPDGIFKDPRVQDKGVLLDIGPDVWFHPFHPELLEKALRLFKQKFLLENLLRSAHANQNNQCIQSNKSD